MTPLYKPVTLIHYKNLPFFLHFLVFLLISSLFNLMAESGIIFAKSTSSPILTTTQSVPASLLMSETPNDVNNDPFYTPNDIYKPKSSPTNAISPSNSIITLPMMSTKERLRERNLEVRELKARVKRKVRLRGLSVTKCRVWSAACGVRSAECGVRSAECDTSYLTFLVVNRCFARPCHRTNTSST